MKKSSKSGQAYYSIPDSIVKYYFSLFFFNSIDFIAPFLTICNDFGIAIFFTKVNHKVI